MTVFMSPRTHYVLGRFTAHSTMAIITIIFLILGGGLVRESYENKESPVSPVASTVLLSLGGLSFFSRNGRKCVRRLVGETFYGSLHSVTGVCSQNSDDVVGTGSPAKEV